MELALAIFAWLLGTTLRLSGLWGKHCYLINHLLSLVTPTLRQTNKQKQREHSVGKRLTESC